MDKKDNKKDNKKIGRCKPRQQKLSGEEIVEELEGYELIKDYKKLRRYDRVKYIRKDTGKLVRGGLVVLGDKDENGNEYLVIQGFARNYKTCDPVRFTVKLSEIILFRKIEDNEKK